jgi:HEAT repeat protein
MLVLAGHNPARARALLADGNRWPAGILIAALCGHDWGEDPIALMLAARGLQTPQVLPDFRARFASILGEHGDEYHAALLVDAVCGNDSVVQPAAAAGLGRLFERFAAQGSSGGERLRGALTATLQRAYEWLGQDERRVIAWLADWARPHVELLMDVLAADEPSRRIVAAKLLQRVCDVRAAETLYRAARDGNPDVSQAATDGLVVLGPALVHAGEGSVPLLVDALGSEADRLVLFALDALGKIGSPRAVDSVVGVLQAAGTLELRTAAIAALGWLGDQRAVEPLLICLGDESADAAHAAAKSLAAVVGRLPGNDTSIPLLRRTLASGHSLVSSVSLRRLSELGSAEGARVVADALLGLDEDLQVQALAALRELDHVRSLRPVLKFLAGLANQPESEVIEQAVLTASSLLRKLAGATGSDLVLVVRMLECPHLPIAREAAGVLGTCSDTRVVGPLLKACLRGDGPLCQAAGKCLRRLTTAAQVTWLAQLLWQGDDCMARGAEAALIAIGERAVEPLIKAVNWPYGRARLAAVRALGKIGDPRAFAVLYRASRDADGRVRELAAAALKTLRYAVAKPGA